MFLICPVQLCNKRCESDVALGTKYCWDALLYECCHVCGFVLVETLQNSKTDLCLVEIFDSST